MNEEFIKEKGLNAIDIVFYLKVEKISYNNIYNFLIV